MNQNQTTRENSVIALYDSHSGAEAAIKALHKAGGALHVTAHAG